MTVRDILVPVRGDGKGEGVLDHALALARTATEAGADVLLIGAWGQSRRRELVMGGVTEHIIEHASLPVLMIH
jgi:nucleotide-binding universal stress UspA family protein